MTAEEIQAAITRMQEAYDALLLGERAVEVSYDGRTVKYQMGDLPGLRRRLAELRAELARVTGTGSTHRAITAAWKG